MDINVTFCDDPAAVLTLAGEFLASEPVLHNLVFSLLHARVAHAEPGRYWVAARNGQIAGVVFQSPLTLAAQLTPMHPDVIAAMVDAIANAGIVLPGVGGDAATAASFAGQWTERVKSAAIPFEGMRLYEFAEVKEIARVKGGIRLADSGDRELIVQWVQGFQDEVHEHANDPKVVTDRWLAGGQVWLWDDGGPKSMAVSREAVGGAVRISGVYTPPESRRRGYAEGCVHALSKRLRESGHRCLLYTDLGNPTSNSIYRRIGYRAVAEGLRYRFEQALSQTDDKPRSSVPRVGTT
jgi:ribosomal protein S18 acetylase RimI-like enzyme